MIPDVKEQIYMPNVKYFRMLCNPLCTFAKKKRNITAKQGILEGSQM